MAEKTKRAAARVTLRCGQERFEMAFDPERFEVLALGADGTRGDGPVGSAELTASELAARLDSPIGSPRLEELVHFGDRVCIVVPDATRACGSARVVPLLLERLAAGGAPDDRIEFLVGAGTHRAPTAGEIERIVGPDVARRFAVHHHDAYDVSSEVAIGTTSRDTPVILDRRLVDADRAVLVGAIGFHYFAGFSGGRKAVLPACAADAAIQANHLLGFDRRTLSKTSGVETGRLDGNPVSEDMEEAARLFGPTFLVNTILNGADRIAALYAGDWRAAHRRGSADYLESHTVPVAERRPLVVASCGGAPRDVNMIQSHKALEHARVVLEDGGDLVLLAACDEGLGRPDFLDWFVPGGAVATARLLVQNYKINGQTAWGIRWKSERYRVRLVSKLPPDAVRRMGMIPHASLEEALAAAGDRPGYIIPNALATLPVLREPARDAVAGAVA